MADDPVFARWKIGRPVLSVMSNPLADSLSEFAPLRSCGADLRLDLDACPPTTSQRGDDIVDGIGGLQLNENELAAFLSGAIRASDGADPRIPRRPRTRARLATCLLAETKWRQQMATYP